MEGGFGVDSGEEAIAAQSGGGDDAESAVHGLVEEFFCGEAEASADFFEVVFDGADAVHAAVDDFGAGEVVRGAEIEEEVVGFSFV